MAQPVLEIPPEATADQIALLQAIKAGQDENDVEISLVLNDLNKGIAKLVDKNTRILNKIQGDLLKQLNQQFVDNDNVIDSVSTHLLGTIQNDLADTHLLLTQLAASGGLTAPGDPLEAALIERVADAPDMAYSASLFMAMREAMPHLAELVKVLREIRDRMPGSPVRFEGEEPTGDKSEHYYDDNGVEVDVSPL